MSIQSQIIFLLSAVGGLTGLFFSGYFILGKKNRRLSDYFLGGLVASLSIRTIKSAFLHYNDHLFLAFIQLGLTACLLIGPFLYLYIRTSTTNKPGKSNWLWHVLPFLLVMFLFANLFPYHQEKLKWYYFVEFIYKQWLIYLVVSGILLKNTLAKVWKRKKLTDQEFWQVSILTGTFLIWLAYETSHYTSYIVGALSFTFIIYTSIVCLVYAKLDKRIANDPPLKYANSTLSEGNVTAIKERLDRLMKNEKPYSDPNLTLGSLSERLGIGSKQLSQVINQTENQNFSQYIASMRIDEAKSLLVSKSNFKISAIAYESGFNSISSFNTHFKNIVGMAASEYREKS